MKEFFCPRFTEDFISLFHCLIWEIACMTCWWAISVVTQRWDGVINAGCYSGPVGTITAIFDEPCSSSSHPWICSIVLILLFLSALNFVVLSRLGFLNMFRTFWRLVFSRWWKFQCWPSDCDVFILNIISQPAWISIDSFVTALILKIIVHSSLVCSSKLLWCAFLHHITASFDEHT